MLHSHVMVAQDYLVIIRIQISLLCSPNKTVLILAEHGRIYFEPIIIKSNYHRCSRPVPALADIPLVEYHSSGGGGDGQQVRFYCILLKITKYFKIPFKKYFHTLDRAQILFRLFFRLICSQDNQDHLLTVPPRSTSGA